MANPSSPIVVDKRSAKTGRFLAGNCGNGGRPPGSRNKLGEAFLADLHAQWVKSGAKALELMAKNDPSGFVRVCASLLPSQDTGPGSMTVEGAAYNAERFGIKVTFVKPPKSLEDE
jgi:hypothetical protein